MKLISLSQCHNTTFKNNCVVNNNDIMGHVPMAGVWRIWRKFRLYEMQGSLWPIDCPSINYLALWTTALLKKLIVRSANQEMPSLLWNTNVHYRVHESRQRSLSWAEWIKSTVSNPVFLYDILRSHGSEDVDDGLTGETELLTGQENHRADKTDRSTTSC
jgi:hypothetical protein